MRSGTGWRSILCRSRGSRDRYNNITMERYQRLSRGFRDVPPGLRSHLRAWLRGLALSTLGRLQAPPEGGFLRCLYCHFVFDDQVQDFRAILQALQRIGTFVDTDTCAAMAKGSIPIDGRYFHLSFDDGFRNIYHNAAPILKELGAPAIVFVPSSRIEIDWETARRYSIESLSLNRVVETSSWDELRSYSSFGIDIGSHTRTHARLSEIDPCRMEDEIAGSKRELEDRLCLECKYFAWPYGTRADVNERALELVRSAGYAACFGAFRGSVRSGKTDPYAIPRHHIKAGWPVSHVTYFALGNREEPA